MQRTSRGNSKTYKNAYCVFRHNETYKNTYSIQWPRDMAHGVSKSPPQQCPSLGIRSISVESTSPRWRRLKYQSGAKNDAIEISDYTGSEAAQSKCILKFITTEPEVNLEQIIMIDSSRCADVVEKHMKFCVRNVQQFTAKIFSVRVANVYTAFCNLKNRKSWQKIWVFI